MPSDVKRIKLIAVTAGTVSSTPDFTFSSAKIFSDAGKSFGNYLFYLGKVENLHLKKGFLSLDEFGVPLPLISKLQYKIESGEDFDTLLENFKKMTVNDDHFSKYEKKLIEKSSPTNFLFTPTPIMSNPDEKEESKRKVVSRNGKHRKVIARKNYDI